MHGEVMLSIDFTPGWSRVSLGQVLEGQMGGPMAVVPQWFPGPHRAWPWARPHAMLVCPGRSLGLMVARPPLVGL